MEKNLIIVILLIFSVCIFIHCPFNVYETQTIPSSKDAFEESVISFTDFSLPINTKYIVDQENKSSITRIKTTGTKPLIIKGSLKATGRIIIEETGLIEVVDFTATIDGSTAIIQRDTIYSWNSNNSITVNTNNDNIINTTATIINNGTDDIIFNTANNFSISVSINLGDINNYYENY